MGGAGFGAAGRLGAGFGADGRLGAGVAFRASPAQGGEESTRGAGGAFTPSPFQGGEESTLGAAGGRGTMLRDKRSPSDGAIVSGAGGTSLIGMMKPHLRHFIRTERPAIFSSAIWYFALQLGHRNFIPLCAARAGTARLAQNDEALPQRSLSKCSLIDSRVASSGASEWVRSHISTALFRKPAF